MAESEAAPKFAPFIGMVSFPCPGLHVTVGLHQILTCCSPLDRLALPQPWSSAALVQHTAPPNQESELQVLELSGQISS